MAWRTFHEAYFNRLFRYLLVVAGGNEELAREALQATLIRVVRHIKVFSDADAFWNWLTVLARSAYADETKKGRRYSSFLRRFTEHASTQAESVRENQANARAEALLERHIALLPPEDLHLIAQKYFARCSVREIANELHTSEKAVESRLTRIRRKLKAAVLTDLKDESQT